MNDNLTDTIIRCLCEKIMALEEELRDSKDYEIRSMRQNLEDVAARWNQEKWKAGLLRETLRCFLDWYAKDVGDIAATKAVADLRDAMEKTK